MKNLSAMLARIRPVAADKTPGKEKALAIAAMLEHNGWLVLKEELDAFLLDAGRKCSDPALPDDTLRITQAYASGIRWIFAICERYRAEAQEITESEAKQ